MNKKGFTLTELLSVIVILGLVIAVATPSIIQYINKSQKEVDELTNTNLLDAAVAYVMAEYDLKKCSTNINGICDGKLNCCAVKLTAEEVIASGLLNIDNKSCEGTKLIVYRYVENNAEEYRSEILEGGCK